MKLKAGFTIALFVTFLGLCSIELYQTVMESFSHTVESVLYSSGIEDKSQAQGTNKEKPKFNLDEILKETDVDG